MYHQPNSYLSPKLEGKTRSWGDRGVFACESIEAGELLVLWGGEVRTWKDLKQLPPRARQLSLQVEENLYLVTFQEAPADWVNHSCDPNAGLNGPTTLVAMRDIAAGEEICFDYAMSDGSPYDQFECGCGTANCRARVTGEDWRLPELWGRYTGYFSPYLQRRIDRLRQTSRSRVGKNDLSTSILSIGED